MSVSFKGKDLSLDIIGFQEEQDRRDDKLHTFYNVSVEVHPLSLKYVVKKRYNDFRALYDVAMSGERKALVSAYEFPPKFGLGQDPASRKIKLRVLLSLLLNDIEDEVPSELKEFIELPKYISQQKERQARLQAMNTMTNAASLAVMSNSSNQGMGKLSGERVRSSSIGEDTSLSNNSKSGSTKSDLGGSSGGTNNDGSAIQEEIGNNVEDISPLSGSRILASAVASRSRETGKEVSKEQDEGAKIAGELQKMAPKVFAITAVVYVILILIKVISIESTTFPRMILTVLSISALVLYVHVKLRIRSWEKDSKRN